MKQQPWEAGERAGGLLRGEVTSSYMVYRPARGKRMRALLCHARPGTTRKEAWDNACDATRATRREFKAAGWVCGRVFMEVV